MMRCGYSEFKSNDTTQSYLPGIGSLTYQWQRSAADSDADYSNIDGGTIDPYNDTGAPENGNGRYFKCVLDATGASQQTSTTDRGYRNKIWYRSFNGISNAKELNGVPVVNIKKVNSIA